MIDEHLWNILPEEPWPFFEKDSRWMFVNLAGYFDKFLNDQVRFLAAIREHICYEAIKNNKEQ